MLHYPAVRKKAQDEIDVLLLGKRLPKFSDRPGLPYVEALLQEVLRHASIFVL
jgi:cytochrome P450